LTHWLSVPVQQVNLSGHPHAITRARCEQSSSKQAFSACACALCVCGFAALAAPMHATNLAFKTADWDAFCTHSCACWEGEEQEQAYTMASVQRIPAGRASKRGLSRR